MSESTPLNDALEAQAAQLKTDLADASRSSGIVAEPLDPVLREEPVSFDTSARKFELAADEQAPAEPVPAYEFLGELPNRYGTKKLFLVARDPYYLYAYWDLTESQHDEARGWAHDGKVFLQIYHANGARIQQIQISAHSNESYLHVNQPDTAFYAEIGYYDGAGSFVVLSRSTAAVTPRDNLSWKTQAQFVTIPFHFTFKQLLALIDKERLEGEELVDALARLQESGFPFPFQTHSIQPLSPDAHQDMLNYLGEGELIRRTRVGSFDFVDVLRKRFTDSVTSGEWTSSMSSPSSPFGASFGPSEREFFMNVNAELIIYGGTDPKATVRVDGQEIKLRGDGTFSYHFNFKDGKFHIPIEAISPDGVETRSALLSFLRLTATTEGVDATPQAPRPAPLGEIAE